MSVDTRLTVIIFFINGINSLLGWSAVLAAFDYFAGSFADFNVYSFLPVPVFMAYLVTGVIFHIVSTKFRYVQIIVVGNMTMFVSLIAILIVSITLEQTTVGYVLMLICGFFIGFGLNLSQLTFYAMINYLSQDVVSKYTVGTAVSGLSITCLRALITLIYGVEDSSTIPIIIYFAIALAFNLMDMVLNIYFCFSAVYKQKIERNQDNQSHSLIETQQERYQQLGTTNKIEKQGYFKTLYETLDKIKPYPYYIMFSFVITFTLYPGPTFTKSFDSIGKTWEIILFNLFYNIGDTLGRYLAEIKGIFNPKSLAYLFFIRLFFIFPITFMAKNWDAEDILTNNNYFPFFNIFLFAVTNGLCINSSFIMAFRLCPQQYKKQAGVLCGLILQLGIILGSIVEIPYSYIIGIN